MAKKKLYYNLSDADGAIGVMALSGCMAYIKADMEDNTPDDVEDKEFTITPIWLTDKQYRDLPEM
jgi:hypothetical protein